MWKGMAMMYRQLSIETILPQNSQLTVFEAGIKIISQPGIIFIFHFIY
jgi:hypothetical protein